jgi:class 3 adenylate cyclase
LLPAQVEIAIAAGNLDTARRAVAELEKVAATYDSTSWEATLLTCRGSLLLAEGDASGAEKDLSRAWRLWQQIELPYESARAREFLGDARLMLGDDMGANLEYKTARSAYSRLGAAMDLRRLGEKTGDGGSPGGEPQGERVTKVFMFTDIVTSTDLIGIIGDAAWERLLRWHDRELRETITAHQGEEVRHTGDGFFIAFDDPRSAIDCAVAIQRRLELHRREHGFSPRVRIGAHLAEATRERTDYSGGGVHEAARIGDIGDGDEIVVSEALLQAAGRIPYPVSGGELVALKGIADPVTVHRIDWVKAAAT